MRNQKPKILHIDFPVFSHYHVHVEITKDIQEAVTKYPQTRSLEKEITTTSDAITAHVNHEHLSFIFLNPDISVGTIAHESWHVVQQILEEMGATLEPEIVAYHLGYLVDRIYDFMHGRKR